MSLTLIIVVITILVSLGAMNNSELLNKLILWPRRMDNPSEYYRLMTSGFIHADYMHLGFNMLALYSFGSNVEQIFAMYLGSEYLFLILYLTGIVAASLPSYMKHRHDSYYRSLGASGGVSAVVFASIYFMPWSKLLILFIPMPGIVFGVLYLAYSAYAQKKGQDNIGHDAHFWGAVYGFLFTLLFEPSHGKIFIEQLMHPQF